MHSASVPHIDGHAPHWRTVFTFSPRPSTTRFSTAHKHRVGVTRSVVRKALQHSLSLQSVRVHSSHATTLSGTNDTIGGLASMPCSPAAPLYAGCSPATSSRRRCLQGWRARCRNPDSHSALAPTTAPIRAPCEERVAPAEPAAAAEWTVASASTPAAGPSSASSSPMLWVRFRTHARLRTSCRSRSPRSIASSSSGEPGICSPRAKRRSTAAPL